MKKLCITQYTIMSSDIIKICQKGILYNIEDMKDGEFKVNGTWFPDYIFDVRKFKDIDE